MFLHSFLYTGSVDGEEIWRSGAEEEAFNFTGKFNVL